MLTIHFILKSNRFFSVFLACRSVHTSAEYFFYLFQHDYVADITSKYSKCYWKSCFCIIFWFYKMIFLRNVFVLHFVEFCLMHQTNITLHLCTDVLRRSYQLKATWNMFYQGTLNVFVFHCVKTFILAHVKFFFFNFSFILDNFVFSDLPLGLLYSSSAHRTLPNHFKCLFCISADYGSNFALM